MRNQYRAVCLRAALLLLAVVSAGAFDLEDKDIVCPVCGTRFTYVVMSGAVPEGRRLDLRPLGLLFAPAPVPFCPTCRFAVLQPEVLPAEIPRLKQVVYSAEYRAIPAGSPSYYYVAQLERILGAAPLVVGYRLLQASWQVEACLTCVPDPTARPSDVLADRYLAESLGKLEEHLAATVRTDATYVGVQMLCGEIERRLGRFEAARRRFTGLESELGPEDGAARRNLRWELALIERRNSAPQPAVE